MADIFISYSHSDRQFAARLYRELQRFKVRGFMDKTDLASGADLSRQLREAIENADAMLVILSRAAAMSSSVMAEIGIAQALGRPVIPVLAPGERYDEAVPPQLVDRLVIDAGSTSVEEVAAKVVASATGTSFDSALSEVRRGALRRQRQLLLASTVLLALAMSSMLFAHFAFVQRNHAEAARAQAEVARARIEAVTGGSAAFSISPDGRTIAAGTAEGSVTIWDLASNRPVGRILIEEAPISALAYSPDGRTIALGDWRGHLQLWDVASGRRIREFRGHSDAVIAIQFSPDDTKLYSRSLDGTLREWSVRTGQQLGIIPLPK